MTIRRKYILPLLFLIQILLVRVLSYFPELVEEYYSNGLYVYISGVSRFVLGWIPFSIGDLAYFILILGCIYWLYSKRKSWKSSWKENLLQVAGLLSVLYFFFNILWGLNYYRVPLYQKLSLGKTYTYDELHAFTLRLIQLANQSHVSITHSPLHMVQNPYTPEEMYDMLPQGYGKLSGKHPQFDFETKSIKNSLYSTPLSFMGFAGYLNPFTGEAHVNRLLPRYNFATTAAHEMAHQIGYASESEANFIGYLSSVHHGDPYIRYSGYTFALKYCLSTLEKFKKGSGNALEPLLNPGILKNYQQSREFWEKYDTFIEEGFEIFYDNFLKLNDQKDGIEGYSKFVGLLVKYDAGCCNKNAESSTNGI